MNEFEKLAEELDKGGSLEYVGGGCNCRGCIAHRNHDLILRALRIAARDPEKALAELIERASHDLKNNQEDEVGGGWWSPMTVKAIDEARSALSALKKAREG